MAGFFCLQGCRYVARGREKVRPGTGREAGLGHAGSDAPGEKVRPGTGREAGLGHARERRAMEAYTGSRSSSRPANLE